MARLKPQTCCSASQDLNHYATNCYRIFTISYQYVMVVFFFSSQVNYCVFRPSLTFHIFDFTSETAVQNSTKLDRKQELDVLSPSLCFFGPIGKPRWPPDLWLTETFPTLKPLNRIRRNLTGGTNTASSTKFLSSDQPRWPPWPILSTKMAYSTQAHDKWPFRSLFFF